MTRTQRLRRDREWSQSKMAQFLNCDQATVSRLEGGQAEPGPIARLLDLLEAGVLPEQVMPPSGPQTREVTA
jgi:transcriptional regulator with XRE-family HTH domain